MTRFHRRDCLRLLATAGMSGVVPVSAGSRLLRFEERGSGPALLVGHPITLGDHDAAVSKGYIDRLSDRYRVIVMEPLIAEADAPFGPDSVTVEKVAADILAVADAANVDRFAWYGFSFGAVVGLQLAIRTDRLNAFVCGGWPPLGGPYGAASAASSRSAAKGGTKLDAAYYRNLLKDWNEQAAITRIRCPRMTFAGAEDTFTTLDQEVRIGPTLRERRNELERMGWTVRLVEGFGHELGQHPEAIVPIIREFLDPLLQKEPRKENN
jgi:pimeloyl-ACP methyl ester carboxylesterase